MTATQAQLTVNDKAGRLATDIIEVQLAQTLKSRGSLQSYEGTHGAQVKFDGSRVIITRKGDYITMMSRSWKNDFQESYPELVSELLSIPHDYIVDAELVFFSKETGRPEFLTALATPAMRAGYEVKIMMFDLLELDGCDYVQSSQRVRTKVLETLKNSCWERLDTVSTHYTDFSALLQETLASGGEGLVLKDLSATYKCGKRPTAWLKVKKVETHDCFVVGMTHGNGKYSDVFGALVLAQLDKNGVPRIVGKCSGMDDETRQTLCKAISEGVYDYGSVWDSMWAENKDLDGKMLRRVVPTLVIEVRCMEKLESGLMRHPVFLRMRPDKAWADCKI